MTSRETLQLMIGLLIVSAQALNFASCNMRLSVGHATLADLETPSWAFCNGSNAVTCCHNLDVVQFKDPQT